MARIENEERRRTCSIPTRSEPESPPPPLPLSLFLSSSSLTKPRSLVSFSLAHITHIYIHTYTYTQVFSVSPSLQASYSRVLPFTILLPFVASRRPRPAAGRSAPDYLGSECLIEALYRRDPELLAPLARPAPLLGFGGGDTPRLHGLPPPPSPASHPHSPRPLFPLRLHLFTFIRLFAGG